MRININKKIISKKRAITCLGVFIVALIIIILLGKKYTVDKECFEFTYKENISKTGKSCQANYYDCILNINGTLNSGNVKVRVFDEFNNDIYISEINQIGSISESVKIKDVHKDEMYYMELSKSEDLDLELSVKVSGKQYGYQKFLDSIIKLLPYRIQK